MFLSWRIDHGKFTNRVLFHRPLNYVPEAALQQHLGEREFPDRRVRKTAPRQDVESLYGKCDDLCQRAAGQEQTQPVPFAISNRCDKAHYKEYTARSQT